MIGPYCPRQQITGGTHIIYRQKGTGHFLTLQSKYRRIRLIYHQIIVEYNQSTIINNIPEMYAFEIYNLVATLM